MLRSVRLGTIVALTIHAYEAAPSHRQILFSDVIGHARPSGRLARHIDFANSTSEAGCYESNTQLRLD